MAGMSDIERVPDTHPAGRHDPLAGAGPPHEALDGLLAFVAGVEGTISVHAPHSPGTDRHWRVTVRFRPLGAAREQIIYGADDSFDGACLLCRGLLAHALASGTAEV
jgi:hypothetical protein